MKGTASASIAPLPRETPGTPSANASATLTGAANECSKGPFAIQSRIDQSDDENTPELAQRCRASIRDCEAVLREALGLSRREAKAFASGGWAAMARRDGDLDPAAVLAALRSFIETLENDR